MRPLAALILVLATATLWSCDKVADPKLLATAANPTTSPTTADLTGHAERGCELFTVYGCTSCHTIPGVRGAEGLIGPPLMKMAHRGYVAGVLKNTPTNLVRWILNPPAVDPLTAMPNLNVTPQDAADMAAYLYTLN
jgi:cytochrome c2